MAHRASSVSLVVRSIQIAFRAITSFGDFLFFYVRKKITKSFGFFEKEKNSLVKLFMVKRGRYSRPFLHFATLGVLGMGIAIGPMLSSTFPIFAQESTIPRLPSPSVQQDSVTAPDDVFETKVSDKLRTTVISYTVQHGDTLSTIAEKFGISTDTIKWANNLSDDSITSGDTLQIPPVTGVVAKVKTGDTIYSIAKKYGTNPQEIADFPGNDFANPETFSLVEGQTVIVPDGKMPTGTGPAPAPVYQETPNVDQSGGSIPYSGGFAWPIHGLITTNFYPWHPGIDIAGPIGTPIYAAMGGVVQFAECGWNTGYGCEVVIKHPNGYWTRYAHMNGQPYVSVGQTVNGGQQIGVRGSTGNSTGPHTHFEIHLPSGQAVNPFNYLP